MMRIGCADCGAGFLSGDAVIYAVPAGKALGRFVCLHCGGVRPKALTLTVPWTPTPAPSPQCPCGIARVVCTYHGAP